MSTLSPSSLIALLIVSGTLIIIAGHIAARGRQSGLCALSQFISCIIISLLGQKETLPFGIGIALLIANILFLIRLARNAARLDKTPTTKADESPPRE